MNLKVKRLTDDAIVPTRGHATDAGLDLYANEDVVIVPGETVVVKTGIAIQLPEGHEGQVRPRSGVTSKTKLRVQLGTIDEGYTGEIGIIVDNVHANIYRPYIYAIDGEMRKVAEVGEKPGSYLIRKGDKLAQLVISPVAYPSVVVTEEVAAGERGANGFGSTGI